MTLWNYCAICGKRIEVGEPCLGVEKKNAELDGDSICFDCVNIENINGLDKTVTITDLLARAEAAEARCRLAEKCFDDSALHACETQLELEKKARTEAEARAEKAEEIASDLCDDFTDFVTGGVPNAAPYFANFRHECIDGRGWCNGDNRVCKGLLPKAAGVKEE